MGGRGGKKKKNSLEEEKSDGEKTASLTKPLVRRTRVLNPKSQTTDTLLLVAFVKTILLAGLNVKKKKIIVTEEIIDTSFTVLPRNSNFNYDLEHI